MLHHFLSLNNSQAKPAHRQLTQTWVHAHYSNTLSHPFPPTPLSSDALDSHRHVNTRIPKKEIMKEENEHDHLRALLPPCPSRLLSQATQLWTYLPSERENVAPSLRPNTDSPSQFPLRVPRISPLPPGRHAGANPIPSGPPLRQNAGAPSSPVQSHLKASSAATRPPPPRTVHSTPARSPSPCASTSLHQAPVRVRAER